MAKRVVVFLWCYASACFSQNDSIVKSNKLDEVLVVGKKQLKQEALGVKSMQLSTKELVKNPTNFTSLLRYTSPIVFRDYGYGGVSTARFRGTSATNTLVLWNGIPINAFGSGQTDFNSLSANISDNVNIQSGGGSVEYGSGAIGGTINLVDKLSFDKHQDFHLFTSFGSFNTTSNFFNMNYGDGKWSVKLASSYNSSDNDYEYIDENFTNNGELWTNENGSYENYGITFALGYQFSVKNKLSFYTTGYYGNRLFSSGLPNPVSGSERNEDLNQRNLIKWDYQFGNFEQLINVSYVTQRFNYFDDKEAVNFDYGLSKNYRISYKLKYLLSDKLSFKTIVVGDLIEGESQGNVQENIVVTSKTRNTGAFVGGIKYKPIIGLTAAIEARKEFNSDFEVPLALSFSAEQKVNNYITFKGLFSSNYRVPTFNELYWPVVGKENLVPETAIQGELGVLFEKSKLKIQLSGYYIKTTDKIIWSPTGGSNYWSPGNIDSAENKGLEGMLNYTKSFGKYNINLAVNYMYTIAKNMESDSFLPYVPKHASNVNIEFERDWLKVYTQTLYQSLVYTNQINIDFYSLDAVFVNNLGIDFRIYNKQKSQLVIGSKLNNIFNKLYYFSNLRPMPEINYSIQINYKF